MLRNLGSRGLRANTKASGLRTSRGYTFAYSSLPLRCAISSSSSSSRNNSDGSSSAKAGTSVLLSLLFATVLGSLSVGKKADSCGIVAVVGENDVNSFLLEGLTILRNRGYDSAGMATVSDVSSDEASEEGGGGLYISKFASRDTTADSIDLLRANSNKHHGHHIGIAHTRWATHGGKTDMNAHPHTDSKKRIALVHNGTVNNSHELRKELKDKYNIHFVSETDTEVISQLVGIYLDKGMHTREALASALARCDGSWGIACVNKSNSKEIVVACNGSPMVIGLGADKTYIASETSAFSKYTKNYIAMKDGEIGVVTAGDSSLDISRVMIAPENDVLLSPDPYPHFTIKECLEQPEAIARALSFGARMNGQRVILGGLDKNIDNLACLHNLLLTGCGTSRNAADFASKLMRDLDCFDTVQVMDAAEVRRVDIPKKDGGLLAVSQSGETKDVIRAVRLGQETEGIRGVISVVNVVGSLIARTTGLGVYLNAGREHAVASTKAFTTQVTVLSLIALWFRQTKEEKLHVPDLPLKREVLEALQRLPISFGMANRLRDQCKKIAQELVNKESMFVLGKGYGEPMAMEGALKIKEMTYIHAEGYSGGALKHGPFALIEDKEGKFGATPVICLILDDDHAHHMRTCAEEVKARGARVIVITDNPKLANGVDENPIIIPNNGPLTALISILPLQFIAYELAVLRGVNPDVPRNLAKAVTTD